MAKFEILRLIAHAIADGFGADDTSGLSLTGSIEDNTSLLLLGLLEGHIVPWSEWFGLAAGVVLGCYLTPQELRTSSEVIAIQCGSTVVAAPWIDLSSEVQAKASFGFEIAQAKLCGVDADYASVLTESTARSSFGDLDLSDAKLPRHGYDDIDAAESSLLATIQSAGGKFQFSGVEIFTLMIIAKVGRYTRIIDPADIFGAIASSVVSRCTHTGSTKPAVSLPSPHRIWSFKKLWASGRQRTSRTSHLPGCITPRSSIPAPRLTLSWLYRLKAA